MMSSKNRRRTFRRNLRSPKNGQIEARQAQDEAQDGQDEAQDGQDQTQDGHVAPEYENNKNVEKPSVFIDFCPSNLAPDGQDAAQDGRGEAQDGQDEAQDGHFFNAQKSLPLGRNKI